MKHISNSYSIDNKGADIITHVFYIAPNKCRVIARQFDEPKVDSITLSIGNETFDIKPSISTEINVMNTVLEEKEYRDQKIPKIIIQTSSVYPSVLSEATKNLIDINPEYEYRFFDDTRRRSFLKETFSQQVLDAYDVLVPGAFKADLFRYAYLFIHGGCYFDDKIIARVPLSDIIDPDDELVLCKDQEEESILNSIIFTEPRNFLFLKLLLTACENVLSGVYPQNMLELTGPKLMYKVFHEHVTQNNFKMIHRVVNNDFNYYKNFEILLKTDQTEKLVFTKTTPEALQRFLTDPTHYRQLWNRREIFYRNKVSLYNISVFVYPNPYVDTFKFTLDCTELSIERADSNDMWRFNLQLKVVDEETNQSHIHHPGMNRTILAPYIKLRPNVSFSFMIDITDQKDNVVIFYDIASLVKHVKQDNEVTVLCLVDHLRNKEIDELNSDHIILFTGSDALHFCKERDERSMILYITETLLKKVQTYKNVKFIGKGINVTIPQKHLQRVLDNIRVLYKRPIDVGTFLKNYEECDIAVLCNDIIQKNQDYIRDLSEIIKSQGEMLEGNMFYDHHSSDFVINKTFENKRWNMFYYSKISVDIMEIGFNAGHSALLYLLSNEYSHIQFFDLGEHKYSRPCFDYLNKRFPNRMSVVWGDSTQTIPRSFGSLFDFIHIDGGHTRYVAESDFHNSKFLASNNCLVIIDDTDGNILYTFCQQMIRYNKFIQKPLLYDTAYHMLGSYT